MDLTHIALLLGEVKQSQAETKEILLEHIEVHKELVNRLDNVEGFIGNARKISNLLGTLGSGLIAFITLKWFK